MTYEATEESTRSGSPIDFFSFSVSGTAFNFVGADTELTRAAVPYTPATIFRDTIKNSGTKYEVETTVHIGLDDPNIAEFAREWAVRAPEGKTTLTIYTRHLQDGADEFITSFIGSVVSARYDTDEKGRNRARLLCKTVGDILAREGPRNDWGRTCGHQHGDDRCQINLVTFTDRLAVTGISGSLLDVTAAGLTDEVDGSYTGGYCTRVTAAFDFRWIVNHVGDVVTLNQPFSNLGIGEEVDFIQGCRHDIPDCRDRYNNMVNYGGVPHTPRLNPFDHSLDRL